jgi:hypothetical protein
VGTVTDSTGAIVPGATVTITNTATNEKRTAESSATGDFNFVSLVPSTYTVAVQKSSFKRFLRDQVVVQVNSTVRVDASLQIGETSETVEVTTQTPLLQTDSGTLGAVIEGKTVNEMPLNGRNTMNLLALAPGVVPTNSSQGGAALGSGGHTITSNWSGYSIGGGLTGWSAMFFDGAPLNVLGATAGAIGFVPTQDSVQEFNVVTSASTSEFGRYSGGVVNMTSKSGSNNWHGSAYEYVRNQILNANEWFNKQKQISQGQPNKPTQWNQNQYGVAASGPIKKDKIFFMAAWEAFHNRQSSLQNRTVPTADERNGIVYQPSAAAATSMINYINGLAGNANGLPGKAGCASLVSGTTKVQIAPGCWDPTAQVMMTEWPTATNTTSSTNFQKLSGTGSDKTDVTGRVDYNISEKQRLFARYVYSKMDDMSQEWMPGGVDPSGKAWHIGGGTTVNHAHNGVFGDTYTFNPSTILDVRLSVMNVYNDQHTPTTGMDMGIFNGKWGTLQQQMTMTNIPTLTINEAACNPGAGNTLCAPTGFGNAGQISFQWNDTESLVVSLIKILGQHSLKMGGEVRFMDRYMLNQSGNSLSAGGAFTFSNNDFAKSGWANFLLGMPSSVYQSNIRKVASFNWYQGYYLNDTWQASRKLTINAGLRWELPGNVKEKKDNAMELAPTSSDKDTGYFGTAVLVNQQNTSGYSYLDRGTEPARHNLFAPNLGFAYRLSDSDAVRGGYAFNYAPLDIQNGMFPETATFNSFTNTWDATGVYGAVFPLSNPFPAGLVSPKTRSQINSGTPTLGSLLKRNNVVAPVPTKRAPYTQQWNLSVSHQFKGDMMVEFGYAGSSAKNLPMTFVYNELDPSHWADADILTTSASGCGPWNAGEKPNGQCRRPYSSYLNFNDSIGPYGWTNYQSMPVRFQKRFRSGGLINASYAWTKALGNTGGGAGANQNPGGTVQDWYNLKAEKSLTAFSLPQRLVVSYVLNLPFGKGQKFLNSVSNGVGSRLVSGWAVNGITTFQSGFPVTVSANMPSGQKNVPNTFGSGTLRPNLVAGCPKLAGGSWKDHVLAASPVINTACWSTPSTTGVGNAPRIDPEVKAPGYNLWDLSIQKKTAVTELVNLEFRAEFFNVWNHERFGMPNSTLNANSFGVIVGGGAGQSQPRLGQLSLRLNF